MINEIIDYIPMVVVLLTALAAALMGYLLHKEVNKVGELRQENLRLRCTIRKLRKPDSNHIEYEIIEK